MTAEPRHRALLKRRLAFEIMQEAALGACNAIAPRLDLLRRLSIPAIDASRRLESALELAVMARRTVEDTYRDAWANEPAPTEAQWRALQLLDRKVSRWSSDLAHWIEREVSERNFGIQAGKSVGDWIDWNFRLDVEFVVSVAIDPDLAEAIARPCISHSSPSGRVRTSVLLDDHHWDSVVQFDRYGGDGEIASGLGSTALAGLSSDLVKEVLLFVPEIAYLSEMVEAIRLRCGSRQLEILLASQG